HEAGPHRVADTDHHDGNRRRRLLGGNSGRRPISGDHVHRTADELGRRAGESLRHPLGVAVVEYDVVTFEVAGVAQPLAESIPHQSIIDDPDAGNLGRLLRTRDERPRRGGAAKQRDELPPPHSITSSASASSWGGISSPIAFAMPRLITNK